VSWPRRPTVMGTDGQEVILLLNPEGSFHEDRLPYHGMDRKAGKLDGPGQTKRGPALLGVFPPAGNFQNIGALNGSMFRAPLGQPIQIDWIGPPDAPRATKVIARAAVPGAAGGGSLLYISADPAPPPWGVHPIDKLLAAVPCRAGQSHTGLTRRLTAMTSPDTERGRINAPPNDLAARPHF
jgi:hypothetical protein